MTQDLLQQKSFKFIDNNLDSTFDKIPDDLLELWILNEEQDSANESEEQCDKFTYFLYAFLKYKEGQGLSRLSPDEDELFDLFNAFQVILGMAMISRSTDVQVKPIKMFDFDNYNKIQIQF